MSRVVEEKAPSYPSSSQRAKDWDKVAAEIKKDEKDNKDEMGGDANRSVPLASVCRSHSFFLVSFNNSIETVMRMRVAP